MTVDVHSNDIAALSYQANNKVLSHEKNMLDIAKRLDTLEKENEALKSQNRTLKTNISILYKTARMELERKDSLKKQMQTEIDRLNRTIQWHKRQQNSQMSWR